MAFGNEPCNRFPIDDDDLRPQCVTITFRNGTVRRWIGAPNFMFSGWLSVGTENGFVRISQGSKTLWLPEADIETINFDRMDFGEV